jgi:hypothetical protein
VTLPLLRPAIAAGATLAFVTGLGDFVTSVVLYTYDTRPLSLEILSSLRQGDVGCRGGLWSSLDGVERGRLRAGQRPARGVGMTGPRMTPEIKRLSVLIAVNFVDMIGLMLVLPILPFYAT